MTGQGSQSWVGSQAQLIRICFHHKNTLHTEIFLSTTPPSSDDPAGKEAGCEGPGLAWLHVVCGCEAG
jgi:hypothetical protein